MTRTWWSTELVFGRDEVEGFTPAADEIELRDVAECNAEGVPWAPYMPWLNGRTAREEWGLP